jgi:hypothetical protein
MDILLGMSSVCGTVWSDGGESGIWCSGVDHESCCSMFRGGLDVPLHMVVVGVNVELYVSIEGNRVTERGWPPVIHDNNELGWNLVRCRALLLNIHRGFDAILFA